MSQTLHRTKLRARAGETAARYLRSVPVTDSESCKVVSLVRTAVGYLRIVDTSLYEDGAPFPRHG